MNKRHVSLREKGVVVMFSSTNTVNGWVEQFTYHLTEKYGELHEETKLKLKQLNEVLGAFDKSCVLAVTDSEGVILEVNDTFCELSGYSRQELIGRTHRIVKSKHHPREFFEHLWRTIKSGKVWFGEIKNRRKRGGHYWVKTAIFPIFDEEGKPERFISVRTDITEGKENEEKLRAMMEKDYSNLIRNLQDLVMRVEWNDGEKGAVVSLIEGKLAEKLKINTENTKGKLIHHILGDEHESALIKKKFMAAFKRTPVSFEFKHHQYYFHISLSPVLDENNKVKEVIGSVSDITKLKKTELKVRNLAFHDQLTALPNRRLLEEDLVYKLLDANLENKKVALVLIDLDQFKNINDTLGHTAGDQFIKMAAKRLQSLQLDLHCDSYTLYHLGGDEFSFVLYGVSEVELSMVNSLILEKFNEPFRFQDSEYYQSVSIGVSIYPDSANHAEEMMKHADLALFKAKQNPNQKYEFFNKYIQGQFHIKVEMENDLWNAVKSEDQFELHYQPIVNSKNGEIVACEALLRWRHPEKNYISPLDFIPTAEERGLIIPIGAWVIEQACKDLAMWHKMVTNKFYMSINLSPRQIQQGNFVEKLMKIIEKYKLQPDQIQLEITENGLMENLKQAIAILKKLREKGFRLAIDDFGTGYSSLSYLKQLPIHCLKIDRSFIKELPHNQPDRAIVSSVIQLGNELGLYVVAEGVECKEAQTYLQKKGCPYLQGYYFSKPLPFGEFTNYVIEKEKKSYKNV